MDAFDSLLAKHLAQANQIVVQYLDKYYQLPSPKNLDTFGLFIVQNVKDVASELALSETNSLSELAGATRLESRHIKAFRAATMEATGNWQVGLGAIYERLSKGMGLGSRP